MVEERSEGKPVQHLYDLLEQLIDRVAINYEREDIGEHWPTGLRDFDDRFEGLFPGSFNLVTGPPGSGKTSFCLNLALQMALVMRRTVIFMTYQTLPIDLTSRLLSIEANIKTTSLYSGNLSETDWVKLNQAIGRLAESPIWLVEPVRLPVMVETVGRIVSHGKDRALVVVDGFELMDGVPDDARQLLRQMAFGDGHTVLTTSSSIHSSWEELAEFAAGVDAILRLGDSEQGQLALEVLTNRYGPRGQTELYFDRATGKVGNLPQSIQNGSES